MNNDKKVMTNKEKAEELKKIGFGFLDRVWCKGADLDNMARGRDAILRAWELLHTPDEKPKAAAPKAEVKQDG